MMLLLVLRTENSQINPSNIQAEMQWGEGGRQQTVKVRKQRSESWTRVAGTGLPALY